MLSPADVCYVHLSGVLFCVGGRGASGDPFRSIECYNFRDDKWFTIAEMSTRRRHVGVVSSDGECVEYCGCVWMNCCTLCYAMSKRLC